ncbi:MAG: hypothetical protein ABEK59_02105 [Halobacteria archaeon]
MKHGSRRIVLVGVILLVLSVFGGCIGQDGSGISGGDGDRSTELAKFDSARDFREYINDATYWRAKTLPERPDVTALVRVGI